MAETSSLAPGAIDGEVKARLDEIDYAGRKMGPNLARVIGLIAFVWSLFQLWVASPFPFMFQIGVIVDVPARGLHLAFGLLLCFLIFPAARRFGERSIPWYDLLFALLGAAAALYLWFGYDGLVARRGTLWVWDVAGYPFPFEAILGGIGILLLLEASRRAIGLPLVVVACVFLIYSVFGQSMPDVISHKGVSLNRLIGYQWLGGEAVFGIPIDVSVSFVFLFVLFGALLERAGAGKYFLDLAFALVGRYRGGPAKAAILASGMTGAISGSSIANVVTTGTFTIPVMKKMGMSAVKAGAIEVAASTNGQIMPPIMGAAAFIMAELLGIPYLEVVKAAFVPAVVSYIALLYISHLESVKLGLKGMPKSDIPHLGRTFVRGLHFLIPIVVLVYLLMVERWTAGTAVFYSILVLMGIIIVQHALLAVIEGSGVGAMVGLAFREIYDGMVAGARNMINIAIAVAVAGVIVGSVSSTGLNNAMVGVVEAISGGNVYVLLVLTAVLCVVLGMGLPTTANYLVVASLLAGVLVELGGAAGLVMPLIAVHLFVFYFGILADDTPPVCLAAFAAAAISRADPIKTGIQGFIYDIRTAILPFIFIFNPELLLIGIDSVWHGLVIFFVALVAMACFSSAVQGWMIVKTRWYEVLALLVIAFALFRPDYFLNQVSPAFVPAPMERFLSGDLGVEAGRKVRLHAVRETDYGERFKLFVMEMPDAPADARNPFGVTLRPAGARYSVADLGLNSIAGKRGAQVGDFVSEVDVEQLDRPAKEWVYPIALALLGLILIAQWRRLGRERAARAA